MSLGFFIIPEEIIKDKQITGNDTLVFVSLQDRKLVFNKIEIICETIGISINTYMGGLKKLYRKGYIKRKDVDNTLYPYNYIIEYSTFNSSFNSFFRLKNKKEDELKNLKDTDLT